MNVRPGVYYSMKAIEEEIAMSSGQIKQEVEFDRPALCCWNLPEINSRASPQSLWVVGVILQIHL